MPLPMRLEMQIIPFLIITTQTEEVLTKKTTSKGKRINKMNNAAYATLSDQSYLQG